VPCVPLLDFWRPDDALELVVYAHSLDLGKKAYGNLVELARFAARGRRAGWSDPGAAPRAREVRPRLRGRYERVGEILDRARAALRQRAAAAGSEPGILGSRWA
jgi:hypothetical protein